MTSSSTNTGHISRYQPCYILLEQNIPCVVWCEDALAHYGVPTVVFSLYLLVQDIDPAAQALIQRGWNLENKTQTKFGNAKLRSSHHRLTPAIDPARKRPAWSPDMGQLPPLNKEHPGPTTTIILPASEWNYRLLEIGDQNFIPPLPALLDALIDKLLDDPLTECLFFNHLGTLITYLYGYVPAVKQKALAEDLQYDHRQFHYDCLLGISTGLPFIRHEQKIREALRNGTYQLCDCSVDVDDESFFTANVEARLRALTSHSNPKDIYEGGDNQGREDILSPNDTVGKVSWMASEQIGNIISK